MNKPRIHLVVERPDGRRSDAKVDGASVTPAMLDSAEDLITTLTCGERVLPKDFYDVCARAFSTTRAEAKKKLLAAMYGAKNTALDEIREKVDTTMRAIQDGEE